MISRAFNALNRSLGLVLIPIIMDIVSFGLGLMITGFWGGSKVTLKLVLDAGLPSISSVIERNVFPVLTFDFGGGDPGTGALAIGLLMFFVGAFAEAGFIGLLYERARGNAVNLDTLVLCWQRDGSQLVQK